MARSLALCAMMLSFFAILTAVTQSFAIDEDMIKATDAIKNNPAHMNMLKKIEYQRKF